MHFGGYTIRYITFAYIPLGKAKYTAKPRVNMEKYYIEAGTLKAWLTEDPPIVYKLGKEKQLLSDNHFCYILDNSFLWQKSAWHRLFTFLTASQGTH